jgi:hypothetical protein
VGFLRKALAPWLCLGAALAGPSALACSVCGCGDPLIAAGDANPSAGNFRFAFDYLYLTASAESDENPTQTEQLTQMTFLPVVVYSPTNSLNLVLQVPLSVKSWNLVGGGLPSESASPFGLGDIDFGLRYFVWTDVDLVQLRRQDLALTAGTSAPTGQDDIQVDGQRIDQHAQLGTGAWGPYLGVLYGFHQDPWNFMATLTGRYRTTNAYGYQFGAAVLWSLTLRYRFVDSFALSIGLDGRYAVKDSSNGDPQNNTGGLLLAVTPGLMWNLTGGLWLYGQVQVPFAAALYGVQSVGPVVTVGLQLALN